MADTIQIVKSGKGNNFNYVSNNNNYKSSQGPMQQQSPSPSSVAAGSKLNAEAPRFNNLITIKRQKQY